MHIPSPARHLQRLACTILLFAALAVGEAAGQSSAQPAVPDENAAARAKRLDALFAGLKSTKVEEEADTMVAEIWRLWLLQSVTPKWMRNAVRGSARWLLGDV